MGATEVTQIDYAAYLQSWAAELASQSDRVRNLIGSAHWLSDGHHKEAILREFIHHYLPSDLVVSAGFITSMGGARNCSPELDILVINPRAEAPLFHQSGICISTPRNVLAHMQVKTSFASDTLKSALENVADAQRVLATSEDADRTWRGIFFYTSKPERTPASTLKTVEEAIKNLCGEALATDEVAIQSLLPTCICCLSEWVIFPSIKEGGEIVLRLFSTAALSAACTMADLFSAVRAVLGEAITGSHSDMIRSIGHDSPTTYIFKVGD